LNSNYPLWSKYFHFVWPKKIIKEISSHPYDKQEFEFGKYVSISVDLHDYILSSDFYLKIQHSFSSYFIASLSCLYECFLFISNCCISQIFLEKLQTKFAYFRLMKISFFKQKKVSIQFCQFSDLKIHK
jgi:hypothetical protein